MIDHQRDFYKTHQTHDVNWRIDQLKNLQQSILKYEDDLLMALEKDMGRPHFESYTTEILIVKRTLRQYIKKVRRWSKPRNVWGNILSIGKKSQIHLQPRGNVLIISPFNYPVQLTLVPLITSIAAGNTSVIKLSSRPKKTAEVLTKIIQEGFKPDYIDVYTGEKEITSRLLDEEFDLIFFTGSPKVGKIIMKKAAETLTPVILELGGKSPAIVLDDADIDLAAERIVWGKFINSGQTCVAPDYVLVNDSNYEALIETMKSKISEFYGEDVLNNQDYSRMIDDHEVHRQKNLLKEQKILFGGLSDGLKVEPTLVEVEDFSTPLMKEEIFGPILPIMTFNDESEIFHALNKNPNPLSLYIFSNDITKAKQMMSKISFGGGVINDTVVHLANENLPFGGVKTSGLSYYHGQYGFDQFSHLKSIVVSSKLKIPFLYPPYGDRMKWFRKLFK